MLKDMNDTDFNEKIVKEDLTIINYSASWCGPCRQQLPTLESLAEGGEFKHCLLCTSPSARDQRGSRMPSSA